MLIALIVAMAGSCLYIWQSSSSLPITIASHFNAQGVADNTMSRDTYVGLMIGLAVLIPLMLGLVWRMVPVHLINVPNRNHWLSPERRTESIAVLGRTMTLLGCAVAVFIGFVHGLVVQANLKQPPHLEATSIVIGLSLFVAITLASVGYMFWRFRRPA